MVQTDRLKIIPLTHRQLLDYLKANNILEDQLGLTSTGRTISEDVKEMVESFTLPSMKEADNDNYLFYTFWIVVDKESNCIVAELGFKGEPNEKEEIEIGYGTMPGQRRKGYMTEAVSGMLGWAGRQKNVRYVLAETHKNNFASIRIVQHNGFVQFGVRQEMLWWRKKVK